jgi:Putative MetA-pathway of phenol degradation
MKKNILIVCLFVFQFTCKGQVEKIDTDRPGKTNSPFTVPKKWLQVEVGASREREIIYPNPNFYKEILFKHPTLLTRYGVSNRFEIRMITEAFTLKEKAVNYNNTTTALNGFQLGGKFNFLKQKGLIPNTSLIAHYVFAGKRTKYLNWDTIAGANFRFAMQHKIADNFLLGYNVGMEWQRFGLAPAYIYTFSPRYNIDEKWMVYAEVFGYIKKRQLSEHTIAGGFAYLINDNFKIDASAGFGINKNAPDNFLSIGASFRFITTRKD